MLLKTECANPDQDSPCRVCLVHVCNGEQVSFSEYLIKPEDAPFYFTSSGLKLSDVADKPVFRDQWRDIMLDLMASPMIVAAADGLSAHVIWRAVNKYGLQCPDLKYINAKAIARRSVSSVSYSLPWLATDHLGRFVDEDDPVDASKGWAELVCKFLADAPETDFEEFRKARSIRIGKFSTEDFMPSLCITKKPTPTAEDVKVRPAKDNPLCGASVVFTGKLESMTRIDAQKKDLRIGGECPERLTMSVDFLVVGDQDLKVVGPSGLSGKMKKAQQYRDKGCEIEILTESEFLELLQIGKRK